MCCGFLRWFCVAIYCSPRADGIMVSTIIFLYFPLLSTQLWPQLFRLLEQPLATTLLILLQTHVTASSSINSGLHRYASQVQYAGLPVSRKGGATMKPIPCALPRKTRVRSPTYHPDTFPCTFHRNSNHSSSSTIHSQLNARRSAMTNSVLRIGDVEREWVRRALTALIRPSRHHMRRRTSFQPQPSRLCHMTTAQEVS